MQIKVWQIFEKYYLRGKLAFKFWVMEVKGVKSFQNLFYFICECSPTIKTRSSHPTSTANLAPLILFFGSPNILLFYNNFSILFLLTILLKIFWRGFHAVLELVWTRPVLKSFQYWGEIALQWLNKC
jgi:hypothetical protein